ncbi:MAG: heavy-metal-associated domain-containing protein [Taibaiella sp.]|jgi:copper chaperone
MKTLKFKTNINCSGCINSVTPHLNATEGITNWNVDIQNADKVLTVETEELTSDVITGIITKAGFAIQEIH